MRTVKCIRCDNILETKSCRAVCPRCRHNHSCGEAETVTKDKNGQKTVQIPGGGFVPTSKRRG